MRRLFKQKRPRASDHAKSMFEPSSTLARPPARDLPCIQAHQADNLRGTEFKEIRKEWKAKKKEEENARKQEDERHRQEAQRQGQDSSQPQGQPAHYGHAHMMPPQMGGPQLPPIGYQAAAGQPAGQYAQPQQVDGAPQYSGNGHQMYSAQGYPQSPYGQQGGLPYQQRKSPSCPTAVCADC